MGELNDSQKRYLLSVLSEINHYLDDITELMLMEKPLFHDLIADLAPAERADLIAFIGSLRAAILAISESFNLDHPLRSLSVRRNIGTNLEVASVELQELTHSKLTGYGALGDATYRDFQIQIDRLQRLQELRISKLGPYAARAGE